jgi:hypothetical protein
MPKANLFAAIPFPAFSPTSTPTPKPTKVPTPTPQKVDLSKYTISVLNGSGVTGAASELRSSLTDAGFIVGTTGNADNSDYTTTEISAKEDVESSYLQQLQEELEEEFVVENGDELDEDDEADVRIIIGTETK